MSLFGTLFNDVYITREDNNGNTIQVIKVPLTYGPKDKWLARVQADPNIDRETAVPVPMLSFDMGIPYYDNERKLTTVTKFGVKKTSDPNKFDFQYVPVPYNFGFNLYAYVKNAEDGTKIAEQILPFFTPDFTVTARLIDDMDVILDIPVVLNGITVDDQYQGQMPERRSLIWTFAFTLKGYLFGPVRRKPIIKFANTTFYVPVGQTFQEAIGNSEPLESVTMQPGLTANGQPTSNVAQSIDWNLIEVDDDYGFASTITWPKVLDNNGE